MPKPPPPPYGIWGIWGAGGICGMGGICHAFAGGGGGGGGGGSGGAIWGVPFNRFSRKADAWMMRVNSPGPDEGGGGGGAAPIPGMRNAVVAPAPLWEGGSAYIFACGAAGGGL